MKLKIEALRKRLNEVDSEYRSIHTAAGDAALDAEQQTRWDALDTEAAELRAELKEAEEVEARAQRVAESRAKWNTIQVGTQVPTNDVDVRSLSGREATDRALKKLEVAGSGLRSGQLDKVERMIRCHSRELDGDKIARALLASETDAYRSAFMKGIMGMPVFTPEEARAIEQVRAASLTAGSGGYGVPVLIDPSIILTSQESLNPIRGIATVKSITSNVWKGVTSAGVSWSWDSEAAEVSDDSPTLEQPAITTYAARGFIPYSIEIEQDTRRLLPSSAACWPRATTSCRRRRS